MNRDQELRDSILDRYFTENNYSGGVKRFENCPLEVFRDLINNDFVNLDDVQNDSPSIRELVKFGEDNDDSRYSVAYSGYVVESHRFDYRVSVDSINGYVENTSKNAKIIRKFAKHADERFIDDSGAGISFEFWWD